MTERVGAPRGPAARRAVVTGCAGFIGGHLTRRLLDDGWDVLGIDALRPTYAPADKLRAMAAFSDHPRFRFLPADLVELPLVEHLADRPVVFHLAARPGVRDSFGAAFAQYLHDNVLATQRLLEASLAVGVPRVVLASSSSVYGDAPAHPCVEATSPTVPISPYGATKLAGEHLAAAHRTLGLDVVALRYFTVYGPNQRPDMAIRRLCEAALDGAVFEVFGDGRQSRDFTHVADVVEATVAAGLARVGPPVLNVGGGHEATLDEVIGLLGELAGAPLRVERVGEQAGDVRRTSAETSLAREALAWEPRVGLREGLADELRWVRAQRAGRARRTQRAQVGMTGSAPVPM